jgi:hypothetical protein
LLALIIDTHLARNSNHCLIAELIVNPPALQPANNNEFVSIGQFTDFLRHGVWYRIFWENNRGAAYLFGRMDGPSHIRLNRFHSPRGQAIAILKRDG